MRLGYACINMHLSNPKDFGKPRGTKKITMNRGMIKKTFQQKGISYASELALENVRDFMKILEWNTQNGINFFRVSSDVFPWASEYKLADLPDYDKIVLACQDAGRYIRENDVRITSHPGPFNKLTSEDDKIFENTKKDLENHAEFFDLLGLPQTPYSKINIHVGASYGNKPKAVATFCRNFDRLPDNVKTRLTVENDDKESLYSTKELYDSIYKQIGIPIVFDFHHHLFCNSGSSERDSLYLASQTWKGITPVVHYSESRSVEQNDPKIKPQAHSDYVNGPINTYGIDVDVMIEAKMKELALIKLREKI